MKIRRANLEDIKGIAKVHVDTWRTTYSEIIPASFLNSFSYEDRETAWAVNLNKVDNVVFVVENDAGEIIGFADTSRREKNEDIESIDLTSLYLLEKYQGNGIGKKLIQTLFEHYKTKGYKRVYVDVLAENKTRHLYEYYGAEFVKELNIKIGDKVLVEYVYVWNSIEDVLERLSKITT